MGGGCSPCTAWVRFPVPWLSVLELKAQSAFVWVTPLGPRKCRLPGAVAGMMGRLDRYRETPAARRALFLLEMVRGQRWSHHWPQVGGSSCGFPSWEGVLEVWALGGQKPPGHLTWGNGVGPFAQQCSPSPPHLSSYWIPLHSLPGESWSTRRLACGPLPPRFVGLGAGPASQGMGRAKPV